MYHIVFNYRSRQASKNMNNQMIKNKLAQATTIIPPIASLHLFLFQNASFFIFVACILIWYYVFLNLISNTVEFSCFFNYKLYFLLVLKHFLNVLWHHLLQICQFPHENIFVVCNLCAVKKILRNSCKYSVLFDFYMFMKNLHSYHNPLLPWSLSLSIFL